MGVKIKGTFGDIDPLNRSLYKRAISGVKKGPLYWFPVRAILKMMTFDLYSGFILTKMQNCIHLNPKP